MKDNRSLSLFDSNEMKQKSPEKSFTSYKKNKSCEKDDDDEKLSFLFHDSTSFHLQKEFKFYERGIMN